MSARNRFNKQLVCALCLGLLITMIPLALSGCYGHFPLTRAVYRMNGNVGSSIGEDRTARRMIQSGVMWVLLIVPVYEVAMFADAFVLNLVEFWTGDRVEISSEQEAGGAQVAVEPSTEMRTAAPFSTPGA